MNLVSQMCRNCGKPFQIDSSRLKHGKGLDCSLSCSYASRARLAKQDIYAPCARCGQPIKTTKSRIKKGADKYCSRDCQHPPLIVTCKNCGVHFRSSPSNGNQFCSKECVYSDPAISEKRRRAAKQSWSNPAIRARIMEGIGRRSSDPKWLESAHFKRGSLHPNYKGNRVARGESRSRYEYKLWRNSVFKRDGYTCQHCEVRGGVLNAHHIKAWADYPEARFDVANGITLCEPCHNKEHGLSRRSKTYSCLFCGEKKKDGRAKRCKSCAAKNRRKA